METGSEPGLTLSRSSDAMVITGYTARLPQLDYIVGTVSDHTLRIKGNDLSLRELCGKNAAVTFVLK
jgi:hypothetical protein